MIARGRPTAWLLLALMWLVAVNLRTVSIGVAPVLSLIRDQLGITYAEAGLLFALPVVLMGLGAEPGGRLADRIGIWPTIAASLGLLIAGGGLRAMAPNYWTMLLLTAVFGAGIGLAQPSLPRLVRDRFPLQRASATGVYSTGLICGSILAAAATGPLLSWLGPASWRGTCLVWAALAAASLVAWLALGPRGAAVAPPAGPVPPTDPAPRPASEAGGADATPAAPPAGGRRRSARLATEDGAALPSVWRDRTAWLITLLFLVQGQAFYQLSAWLPAYYQELGFDVERASQPLAVFIAAMLPVGLAVTYLSDRHGRRRPFLVGSSVLFLFGMAGLLLDPLPAFWLWTGLLGVASAAVFALALALPTDLLDPRRAGATISLVFTIGYAGTLVSPLLAGAVRDALGSFTLAFLPTVGYCIAILVLSLVLPETGRGLQGTAHA